MMREDIKIYTTDEIVQGTPEWFAIRDLKFTASKASEIATNGKGLETLCTELLAGHYSSQQYDEYTGKYKNPAMQRGNDYEAQARMVYEFETGNSVREVGFVEVTSRKYVGCSPDGLVTENGKEDILLEIKNHDDKVFLELILSGKVDPKYVKQMQYHMWVTGASACDYFGYNPNFKPSFYMERFYPDEELFAKFDAGVTAGADMLDNGLRILGGKGLEEQEKYIEPEAEAEVEVEVENKCPEIENVKEATEQFFNNAVKNTTKETETATAPAVADDFPF